MRDRRCVSGEARRDGRCERGGVVRRANKVRGRGLEDAANETIATHTSADNWNAIGDDNPSVPTGLANIAAVGEVFLADACSFERDEAKVVDKLAALAVHRVPL